MDKEAATPPEAAPPSHRPESWRMVLAVLSFGLGLVSCLTCVYGAFSGLPAIVLGVVARRNRPPTVESAPAVSIAKKGIILGLLGTIVSAPLLFIVVSHFNVHNQVLKAACQNNLKSIGVCLDAYAEEHNGAFPVKLSALYPEYVSGANVFACPATETEVGDPSRIDDWTDYTYVPGLRKTGTPADANVLVCYDNAYHHMPKGRNELYLDGRVEFHRFGQPHRSLQAGQP